MGRGHPQGQGVKRQDPRPVFQACLTPQTGLRCLPGGALGVTASAAHTAHVESWWSGCALQPSALSWFPAAASPRLCSSALMGIFPGTPAQRLLAGTLPGPSKRGPGRRRRMRQALELRPPRAERQRWPPGSVPPRVAGLTEEGRRGLSFLSPTPAAQRCGRRSSTAQGWTQSGFKRSHRPCPESGLSALCRWTTSSVKAVTTATAKRRSQKSRRRTGDRSPGSPGPQGP